ncbi:cell division protein FtsK [Pseudomonas panipatensis]|uniref:DNA segregation ATPase FtsK/SpoIIIE, S-DNA-T family n=1 Tax=Pseudomonas panipatensis TaxID=428992 RepID=A0A1G8LGR9_9PSED|nr:cell division protein FtsK [Pseudomonas panipatensis]SDI54891.1 hypothetical protein SAMN05216272_111146 [Pseudomonas panipatensis]SMP74928.1 hypothetical protein SAMN06295951_11354 [Pseudomonas panipatensis]
MTAQAAATIAEDIVDQISEDQPTPSIVSITAETLGRDLLQVLLQEVRVLPDVWPKLSEKRQADVIDRLRSTVDRAVKHAVKLISAGERPAIDGILESVAIKEGIKATFKVSQFNPLRHDLIDRTGKVCMLVVADAAQYLEGMEEVQPDPDQNELELNGGDHDMQEEGAWAGGEQGYGEDLLAGASQAETFGGHTLDDITTLVLRRDSLDVAWLQSRFALSTDEALRVALQLLDAGVIVLETEGTTPDLNAYRVTVAAPPATDEPVNLE